MELDFYTKCSDAWIKSKMVWSRKQISDGDSKVEKYSSVRKKLLLSSKNTIQEMGSHTATLWKTSEENSIRLDYKLSKMPTDVSRK